MKRIHLYLVAMIGLLFSLQSSFAQFDPGKTTTIIDSKVDTLKVNTDKTSEMLDFKIYNDAYDKYLRELQKKHRNWFESKSGIQFTQTALSNWAAGGVNSFSGRAYANMTHKYTAPSFRITSKFNAALGVSSNEGQFRKTEDFFILTSEPSWNIAPRWEFTASFNLTSQFTNTFITKKNEQGEEYASLKSTYFAPAYLNAAPGIKHTNKKGTIEVFFSPTAGNMIMVLNQDIADQAIYGPAGRKYIPQFINKFSVGYKETINKLTFDLKVESYWSYNHGSPRLVTINKIDYKLTKVLTANFFFHAIYDDTVKTPDENNHFQMTETIGLGIGYNFASKKHPAPPESPRKNYKRNLLR